MGFLSTMDAFEFVVAAIQPSLLLQPKFYRQSRPLYILMGSVVGYTVYYTTYPLHNVFKKELQQRSLHKNSEIETEKELLFFCFFYGYVILNIAILLISLLIFDKIMRSFKLKWVNKPFLYGLMLFLLVANSETKYFIFSPHQQLFNILVPIISIYLATRFVRGTADTKTLYISAFLSGIGMLVYGNALLLLGTLAIIFILRLQKERYGFKKLILHLVTITFLFIIPLATWQLILILNHTTLYSAEMEGYRQFVWMIDSLKISFFEFLKRVAVNSKYYLNTLGVLIPSLSIFILSILLIDRKRIKWNDQNLTLPALLLLMYFIFYLVLGYYADRLTFGLTPFIIFFTAYILKDNKLSTTSQLAILMLGIVQFLLIAIYDAPHFSNIQFYN